MKWNVLFFFNSIMLGTGLAMDAFSVSLADALNEPEMKQEKMCGIAGVFAFFQALMPLIGWICVHTIVQYLKTFERFVPWIALALLVFIGGNMLIEGLKKQEINEEKANKLGLTTLLVQGIATSIDALSVGFTIAKYDFIMALTCAAIIAIVTYCICMLGLTIGKKFGTKFSGRAAVLGGMILILIGMEIFITGIF